MKAADVQETENGTAKTDLFLERLRKNIVSAVLCIAAFEQDSLNRKIRPAVTEKLGQSTVYPAMQL